MELFTSTYALSGEMPEVLHIFNPPSDLDAQDEDRSVNVSFKLAVADGPEGLGVYGHLCIAIGDTLSAWYQDEAKVATGKVPKDWSLSMRDFLVALAREECTPTDYLLSELLRTMVDRYQVSASIEELVTGIRVAVSFSRKRYIVHEFEVEIPNEDYADLLDEDYDEDAVFLDDLDR